MALHGDIRVNGGKIGDWEAVRRQHPPNIDFNVYDIVVTYTDPLGNRHGYADSLVHRYGDGAITLAAEVLRQAARKLPPQVKE